MSDWLFDLGNSHVKCAPLQPDGRPGDIVRVAHDGAAPDDAPFDERLAARLPARIDVAWVSSVAATPIRVALLDALSTRASRIALACTQPRFGDVVTGYPHPDRLGVDRFLALLGARARSRHATLVVGVGTALTIDLLDADGRHRGGRIAPSPALMRAALHARAAQLPEHGGAVVEFATDTRDALASGCDGAALALIAQARGDSQRLTGAQPEVLMHGGGSVALRVNVPGAVDAPALVLEGLAIWAKGA